jgi:hypothetical protein
VKKCKPSKYAVVAGKHNERIEFGFRCGKHGIHALRFSSRELRDAARKDHQKRAKKS